MTKPFLFYPGGTAARIVLNMPGKRTTPAIGQGCKKQNNKIFYPRD